MISTQFFEDFKEYYRKAKILQDRNCIYPVPDVKCNDPLMDSITIYDTVNRRYAGFSKALEDAHGVRVRSDLCKYKISNLGLYAFHFVHLFHRFTGSGASFQPATLPNGKRNPKEHGYCNNHVEKLCEVAHYQNYVDDVLAMKKYIVECQEPMVTSVGNQPPSLKNGDPSKYRLAMQYYFDNFATEFVKDYVSFAMNNVGLTGRSIGIKDGVDFSCHWHKSRNFKQWHFVLTAFVMDTAEYYPELVDPTSHCYYGANCVKAFELMFVKEKSDPKNKALYQEVCMTEICKAVNGRPYDVEDVACDFIRYLVEYVPKGYNHLTLEQRKNNSTLKVNGIYPEKIQQRIQEVIG